MDDRQRLLRIISLVAWAGEIDSNQCGLRFADEADEKWWQGPAEEYVAALERGQRVPQPEGGELHNALWALTSWYAGAVWHRDAPGSPDLDTREFPAVALRAVDGLPVDVLALLGRMVRKSLALDDRVEELGLARLWADDVRATAWRLLVAEREDRFGRPV